jgi:hypothetical protein
MLEASGDSETLWTLGTPDSIVRKFWGQTALVSSPPAALS